MAGWAVHGAHGPILHTYLYVLAAGCDVVGRAFVRSTLFEGGVMLPAVLLDRATSEGRGGADMHQYSTLE